MRARVHMCVCCTHLSIFGDGQQLVALVLSSLLYWKQSAVSPKGRSWSFHSQARGSAPPGPCPQGGGGRFGGCLLLMVTEGCGPPSLGVLVGVPRYCAIVFFPAFSWAGRPLQLPSAFSLMWVLATPWRCQVKPWLGFRGQGCLSLTPSF